MTNKIDSKQIDGAQYQNPLPTTTAIGGIPAGSTFFNTPKSFADFALASGYAYINPAFTAFSITGAVTQEVGQKITGVQTFTWAISNIGNVQANSINIYDTEIPQTLITGHSTVSPATFDFSTLPGGGVVLNLPGVYTWRIEGINTNLQTFLRNYLVNWYWRKFWGTNASATLTEAQIEALVSQNLSNVTAGNYSFAEAAGQYKYFAFQKDLPQPNYLTDFKDQATGFNVAMQPPYLVTITNSFLITTDYYIYRTTNIAGGAATIVVSN